nr:aminoacyl-tRNA synthetase, class 1a, anticodon-binding [Tanacetum cinerariifolium]
MRRYQGPDMPLLAHMLNLGEPAFEQAQQPDVYQPPPSPVVAPHPSPDQIPSPLRQSLPPPIPFGPAPTSGVVSTKPIPDIPSSFGPSEPVLETINSPFGDNDTGGGSFHESPPRPPPATLTMSLSVGVTEEPLTLTSLLALFLTCLQRIATLKAKLKATKLLHRDTVVFFAKRIKKLESKLKTKKRKLVLSDSKNEEEERQSKELDVLLDLANEALHEPSLSTTPSKPVHTEQSSEQEINPTTLDKKSSSGLDFTDAEIPAGGLDSAGGLVSAGGVDSAGGLTSAGISVADGPTIPAEPSLLAQRVAEEQDRESMASVAHSTHIQAELDRVALNLSNEEWIGLVDQVRANLTLSTELLGADVSEDTFSVRMVELMNRRRKAIAEMKAKAKREKPMTPAQQKEFMGTFVKNQTKDQHQHLKRSGGTLESSESKKLKSSHSTTQPAELQETTYVSACVPIATGDPIFADVFVSASSSIPAATPIAADVSTTAGASGSANDTETAFKRYLRQAFDDDEPAKPVSLAWVSDITTWEIIPTEFGCGEIHVITRADGTVKRFSTLRELMYWAGRADLMVLYGLVLDKYKTERATGIGLGLWMDLRILITYREERDASIIWDDQDQWQIQSCRFYAIPAIHVLETKAGDIMYMFVDKKYPLTPATLQRMLNHDLEIDRDPSDLLKVYRALIMPAWVLNCSTYKLEEIVMAMMTYLKSSGVHYQCFTVKCGLL